MVLKNFSIGAHTDIILLPKSVYCSPMSCTRCKLYLSRVKSHQSDKKAWSYLSITGWMRSTRIVSLTTEGYQSPLRFGLISQLSRLLLCGLSRRNINAHIIDVAFQASCDACTTFRALQKKRQIAQPWLVIITQFQADITIHYIIWDRGISMPKEADLAISDVLATLAYRR
jgi:hypothetical protein